MTKRDPRYIYKANSKGTVLAYEPIVCAQCGKDALARAKTNGRFCSYACSVAWTHAQGRIPDSPSGEESPYWKGSKATYSAMHKRVVRTRGAADHCELRETAGCRSLTFQWAWIHGTDPGDVQNYRQLCRTCHVAYDEQAGAGNVRAKLTDEQAAEIRRLYVPRVRTLKSLADEFGVSIPTIHHVVKGESYKPNTA